MIPKLEHEIAEADAVSADGDEAGKKASVLSDAVTADDVAEVVGRVTGIPASTLMAGEKQQLLHMEVGVVLLQIQGRVAVVLVAVAIGFVLKSSFTSPFL